MLPGAVTPRFRMRHLKLPASPESAGNGRLKLPDEPLERFNVMSPQTAGRIGRLKLPDERLPKLPVCSATGCPSPITRTSIEWDEKRNA